jgi:thiosulfate reductase/polysulfide reductase chain A
MRRQAVSPRYDTRPGWLILQQLAHRLDLGKYFPYESIEDIWNFQLKDMGVKIEDFDAKGFVVLTDQTLLWDREKGLKFKTPSGKIELVSPLLESAGFPSFPPYTPVSRSQNGDFKLLVGRCAAHTHVSTQNNLYLSELVPENVLWINDAAAARLGIKDGGLVEVSSPLKTVGRLKAKVTDLIHPEAVFMLHGFGKTVPAQSRCYLKGASDALLQENVSDRVGGSPALDETVVTVKAVKG